MTGPEIDLHLTRRRLVQVGGATTALVALGGLGRVADIAAATDRRHFSRATYLALGDRMFDATGLDGSTSRLTLTAVADLDRARSEPSFAGRDDAFALLFTGPGARPLPAGITTLTNGALGSFELFLTPVGAAADVRTYELVVDRSVPVGDVLADAPRPLANSNAASAPSAAPVAETTPPSGTAAPAGGRPPAKQKPAPRRVLAATLARRGGVLAADVRVAKGRGTVAVRVSVLRGDTVVARGAERLKGRVGVRIALTERRRLPKGTYTLAVTTVDKAGKRATTRRRATL